MATLKTAQGGTTYFPDPGKPFRTGGGQGGNVVMFSNGVVYSMPPAQYISSFGQTAYNGLEEYNIGNDAERAWQQLTGGNFQYATATPQTFQSSQAQPTNLVQKIDPNNPNAVVTTNTATGERVGPQNNPNPSPGAYSGPILQGQSAQDALYSQQPSIPSGGVSGGAVSNGAGGGGGGIPTTGDPQMDETLKALQTYLDDLQKRGQILNPDINLTPEKLAEFMSQAEREIHPFYASNLKLAKNSLLTSLGYSRDQLQQYEQDAEKKYGKSLRDLQESAAEQGFAQSGRRIEAERDLATETQQDITNKRRDLSFGASQDVGQFAEQYGTPSQSEFPTLSQAPTVSAGAFNFSRPSGSSPLYNLSPDVYNNLIGSQQYEEEAAKRTRASGLEEAFRSNEVLKQQRQLIL